jgi:RecA-family ATPase
LEDRKISIQTVAEKLALGDIAIPEPVICGLLYRKSLAVLGAPDDSFKTQFAVQLAVCLTQGIPCYSFGTKPSYVAYIVLEAGESYILERIEEKIAALGLDRENVLKKIYIADYSQKQLDDENVAAEIERDLISLNPRPDVVIFDPITYALKEDSRFSPEKTKLCKNLLKIANGLNGVCLAVIHCRKSAQNNDSMDDFLGTSIVADMAATRIKLFREGDQVTVHVKTRYAERPDQTFLRWSYPLLKVEDTILSVRQESKILVADFLSGKENKSEILGELVNKVAEQKKRNVKTIRVAINELEFEGKVTIERIPGKAAKMVKLVEPRQKGGAEKVVVYAS